MLKEIQFARPYAIAAFEYAHENNVLEDWSVQLKGLAQIAEQEAIQMTLKNPDYDSSARSDLFIELGQGFLNEQVQNFIRLLAAAHRLSVLPEVYELYESLYTKTKEEIKVDVISAIELDDAYKTILTAKLKKRFEREPVLHCHVDKTILGGLIIRAGDEVINVSLKGQFNQLKKQVIGELCN